MHQLGYYLHSSITESLVIFLIIGKWIFFPDFAYFNANSTCHWLLDERLKLKAFPQMSRIVGQYISLEGDNSKMVNLSYL